MVISTEAIASKNTHSDRVADPHVFVIFGAAGDLTKRKLIPALYNLASNKLLPKEFAIVGIGRTPMNTDDFRRKLSRDVHQFATEAVDTKLWNSLLEGVYYLQGEFDNPNTYSDLKDLLARVDRERGTRGNYLYYLATAPGFFCNIIAQLANAGIARQGEEQWRRVAIEKPFGYDLESARSLNRNITSLLEESQIYRIDHYLGKETVQNIMVFRFGNGLFEPIWNHHYIDRVEITVAETVGVEDRGGYYEGTGALRDMVQNHLFQMLAMVAMEPPVSFNADAVRDEKSKVLQAIELFSEKDVFTNAVRGQYGEGIFNGNNVLAYRSEPRVASDSSTETFAALKLTIDNWRWANVPFYLRTGKRMAERVSEIAIKFKQVPSLLFRQTPIEQFASNYLILRIQPNDGIGLQFGAKVPGPIMKMGSVEMDFCYADYFNNAPTTGYETLIYDCAIGDATLFQRSDNVELGWSVVKPILDVWGNSLPADFPNYAAGSWGPLAAEALLARDGHQWRKINPSFCSLTSFSS
jgi:glucose-6-phosphate 1-dehydrogenase